VPGLGRGPRRGDLNPGELVGEYIIERKLAHGGFGTVYVGEHRTLGRRAAIKVLGEEFSQSVEIVQRFRREARAVNQIGHPNIIDIHDFGQLADKRPYYVMELLAGDNLRTLIHRHGRYAPAEVVELLEPVCAALQAAHDAGVVHRDLKASNIVVAEQQGRRVVKLLDFGVAKLVTPGPSTIGLTAKGVRLGTPIAMSPEQIRGEEVDGRADVYALGVLAFQLLTARLPFRAADPAQLEHLHLHAPPPRPSDTAPLPLAIDAVILRCLEKPRDARYGSSMEFLEALRAAVSDQSSAATGPARRVMGVFVGVTIADQDGEPDDEVFDAVAAVLETAEASLVRQGYAVTLQTGDGLLATLPLPAPDDGAERQVRAEVVQFCLTLYDRLEGVAAGADPLNISLTMHVDEAATSGADDQFVAGRLMEVGSWSAYGATGVCATGAALGDLDEPRVRRVDVRG
jgi:hypothetical protein